MKLKRLFGTVYIPLFILTALFLGFGFHHLTKFVTADEHYWIYERIPQYWSALKSGKLKNTLINDKPGVSLALVSGTGLLFIPDPASHQIQNDRKLDIYRYEDTGKTYASFRAPILLLNAAILLYFFWIVRKVSKNKYIALWTVTGIGLSPILIGISQIINPDSLLWSSATAAFFTYLATIKYPKRKLYVALTTLWLTFAILSKYTATVLFPTFLLFFLWHSFFYAKSLDAKHLASLLRRHTLNYLAICFGSAALVSIIIPAILAKPLKLIELFAGFSPIMPTLYVSMASVTAIILIATFPIKVKDALYKFKLICHRAAPWIPKFLAGLAGTAFLTLIIGRHLFPDWPLFEIRFDVKRTEYFDDFKYAPNIVELFLFNLRPFVFSLIPTTIALLLVFWIASLFRRQSPPEKFLPVAATAFMFIFLVANTASGAVTTIRYSVMLYPMAAIVAAYGLESLTRRYLFLKKHRLIISILYTSILSISVFGSAPFYFNYTNSLLPKESIITDAWGYGGYEAAQYINSLPDSDTLTVWSDYYGVCEFIRGNCITSYNYEPGEYPIDYYVLTRRGRIRYGPERDDRQRVTTIEPYKYYDRTDPIWKLEIGGRPENTIRIHRAESEALSSCDGPDNLCVGIITDIAACQTDPGNYDYLRPLLKEFVKSTHHERASFNVSLGDNANYNLRNCNESGEQDIRWVKDHLNTQAPTHYLLGDHDLMNKTETDRFWRSFSGHDQLYFSFDVKNFHVVALDTILGGDRMREICENDPICSEYQKLKKETSEILRDPKKLQEYLQHNNLDKSEVIQRKAEYTQLLEQELEDIKNTRLESRRDKGRISDAQLEWLKNDLRSTKKNKVLLLSDHPLFHLQSHRKLYDIVGREALQKILFESQKDIVSLSGEAHIWHEETINNVHYYSVDEFIRENGSWAIFRWNDTNQKLIRYINATKIQS